MTETNYNAKTKQIKKNKSLKNDQLYGRRWVGWGWKSNHVISIWRMKCSQKHKDGAGGSEEWCAYEKRERGWRQRVLAHLLPWLVWSRRQWPGLWPASQTRRVPSVRQLPHTHTHTHSHINSCTRPLLPPTHSQPLSLHFWAKSTHHHSTPHHSTPHHSTPHHSTPALLKQFLRTVNPLLFSSFHSLCHSSIHHSTPAFLINSKVLSFHC